ncbi:MAG: MFS transporter [Thermoproteota archaeon]
MGRRAALAALAFVVFIGPFGGNMVLPMFGALRRELGANTLLLGLTVTAYMVPFGIAQLFSGAVSDIAYGRRTTITAGLAAYGAGALGSALAPSMGVLLAFRALQGAGNAFTTPIAMAAAGDIFPREVRGRVMGILSLAATLGVALGPAAGGLLSAVSWRLGFGLLAALAAAAALLVRATLPEAEHGKFAARRAGVSYAVRRALAHRGVLAVGLAGFLVFAARTGLVTYLSDLLTLPPYNLSEPEVGGLLTLVGIGGLAAGPAWGFLADKVGRRTALLFGVTIQLPLLAAFSTSSWYSLLPVLLLTYGFTVAAVGTALSTLAVEVLPELRGTATSIYGSFRFLGYAAAPPLFYPAYAAHSISGVSLQALAAILTAGFLYLALGRSTSRLHA